MATKLERMIIQEMSGVDSAANELDGWILMKSRLTPEQQERLEEEIERVLKSSSELLAALEATIPDMVDAPDDVKAAAQTLLRYCEEMEAEAEVGKAVTSFQDLPLADPGTRWDAAAAVARVRAWAGAEDAPNAKFARAFLWRDPAAPDEFGSYKLPYADVVDGSLKAVPAGIFAAAGALSGARGGVSIPATDKDAARAHLDKYYAKMDKPAPWSTTKWRRRVRELLGKSEAEPTVSLNELRDLVRETLLKQEVIWGQDERTFEELRCAINEAIKEIWPGGGEGMMVGGCPYVRDISETAALICRYDGCEEEFWVVSYTVDASDDVVVAPMTQWIKAEQAWVAAPAEA